MSISSAITSVDLFKRTTANGKQSWNTGTFVGRPFHMSYSAAQILVCDAWKQRAHGIPQGSMLLAYYDCQGDDQREYEAILLRVIEPTTLPQDGDVITSMIEYYQEGVETGSNEASQLDNHTRYRFSFSGLKCSILGCFFKDGAETRFGADLENFYAAHNYSVIKPNAEILRYVVNHRETGVAGGPSDIKIGRVRYSSSNRFQSQEDSVPVYVNPEDFAGKRTALFGMTRTGKSNTTKIIIQSCVKMSEQSPHTLDEPEEGTDALLSPFASDGIPKYPIGQIVFDINGEYANPNLQDSGTAIFDMFEDQTIRYSTVEKPGTNFRVLRVNFYKEIDTGFSLVDSYLDGENRTADYLTDFRTVQFNKNDVESDVGERIRNERRKAVYFCLLKKAGFSPPENFRVKFAANEKVRDAVTKKLDQNSGNITATLDDAISWWEQLWEQYDTADVFNDYRKDKGHEWADDDLKALLRMLTRKKKPGGKVDISGFLILKPIVTQHTSVEQIPFEKDILAQLREGKIVIVDLSLGDTKVQKMFSKNITKTIFSDSLNRFTETRPNNFIQFYFEEAHNLFPKKEESDLSQIYNRLAKEGAKLNLGLVYATQEVSSISNNILKNTQNWFVSHLNNHDEIRELRKYYDFQDFAESLIRFSQDTDKGFARAKTYSNSFVVPVQIDKFPPDNSENDQ